MNSITSRRCSRAARTPNHFRSQQELSQKSEQLRLLKDRESVLKEEIKNFEKDRLEGIRAGDISKWQAAEAQLGARSKALAIVQKNIREIEHDVQLHTDVVEAQRSDTDS